MPIQLEIPKLDSSNRLFLTWVPIRVRVRQVEPPTPTSNVDLTFQNGGSGGQIWFAPQRAESGNPSITLTVPADGSAVEFWIAGVFQNPSESFGDAELAVFQGQNFLGSIPAMVRVRKDADTLTEIERDRFVNALGILNAEGAGRFGEIRAMHTNQSNPEAHGDSGFPPWHRVYTLDLERELQSIDPQVTLPYWRFDRAAPNVFSEQFMGAPNGSVPRFSPGHPLESWVTDGTPGILRSMLFDPAVAPGRPIDEATTLTLGGANNEYRLFRQYEGNPHGSAHVSFSGFLSAISTAARDPLFFMLHANVDRLWAKWQWFHRRHSRTEPNAYFGSSRVGHNLEDTMWPWNGDTTPPRPATAPGGALQESPITQLPGPSPMVVQMLDYMNVTGQEDLVSGGDLGFSYDDVPFEIETSIGVA